MSNDLSVIKITLIVETLPPADEKYITLVFLGLG